jgi:outer membrane protein assembly factor BamA
LIDVGLALLNKKHKVRTDSLARRPGKLYVSAVPASGYTLITGLAVTVAANAAFYTSVEENSNVSSILTEPAYTQYKQLLIPVQVNIWTPGNRYNIQADWGYKRFPQNTYGLGGHNSLNSAYQIDYSHLRFYQTVFKAIRPDFFAGAGYYLDHFWSIREVDPPAGVITDFQKYGLTKKSTSSGITLNLLYDLRRNSINPKSGWYGNVIYRPNFTFLGSDSNWQTLLLDFRKYVSLPYGSNNILAFWNYEVLTLQGKPPYLALPFTGSDTYINSGRGYIQGRFRGQKMLYLETEYRFGILRSGLLGGVVFANVQSFSEPNSGKFEVLWPAWGGGLRIKLNKFSRTNIALDYGFGAGGSHGIFVNLGEVF